MRVDNNHIKFRISVRLPNFKRARWCNTTREKGIPYERDQFMRDLFRWLHDLLLQKGTQCCRNNLACIRGGW